jgi:membrane-associated phospholipid phosphatase
MFVVSMGLALVGYTLFPTAPPRMYPQYGFVDTLTKYAEVGHDSTVAKIFINPYAAVPSMHCAFAMMIGGSGIMVCRRWWAKAWWACWPLLVSWVTIVTANHYWVDAALGWTVALCAALAAARLAQARPEAWAFRVPGRTPAPQEAEA